MRVVELRIHSLFKALRERHAELERELHRERRIVEALVARAGGEVRLEGAELAEPRWQSRREDHETGDIRIRVGPTEPIILGVTPLKNPERLGPGETGTVL